MNNERWTKIVVEQNETEMAKASATALISKLSTANIAAKLPAGVEAWKLQTHSARYVYWFSPAATRLLREAGALRLFADHVTAEDRPDLNGFTKLGL